jgi:hypothetical protein
MRIALLLSIVLLSGCAVIGEPSKYRPTEPAPPVKPDYGAMMLQRQNAKWDELTDAQKRGCIFKETGEIGDCSLVFDVWNSTHTKTFVAEHCAGKKDKSCNAKIAEAYSAGIQLRYASADFKKISLRCKSEGGCGAKQYESRLLMTHNLNVFERWAAAQMNQWSKVDAAEQEVRDKLHSERRADRGFACFTSSGGGVMICE